MTKDEAIAAIASQEWLSEGIWCIFCEADRVAFAPLDRGPAPHEPDCPWAALAEWFGKDDA